MGNRLFPDDERGFSETFAVGVLVGITVLMALSVGVYVLFVGVGDDEPTAEFTYSYDEDTSSLLVRFSNGDPMAAGNVSIESTRTAVRWAEVAGMAPDQPLESGDAIQLSGASAWGRPITGETTVEISLVRGENRTQLSNWSTGI